MSERRRLRFAAFELDCSTHELRRDGRIVRLQLQPACVLEILAANSGNVVTREEFRKQVWPASVFLDFDHGLNNAINRLRQALGDTSDNPQFIETVPRVGYRFLVPATEELKLSQPVSRAGMQAADRAQPPARPDFYGTRLLRPSTAVPAIGTLVVVALVIFGIHQAFRASSPTRAPSLESAASHTTTDRDAYEAYARGRHLWNQRNKEAVAKSIEYFKRAIELDPDFALAYAGLAEAYATAGGNTLVQSLKGADVQATALNAAHRALQLDASLGEAHAALGQVMDKLLPWSADNDTVIEHAYRRAIELSPKYADVRLWYGNFLSSRERSSEAIAWYREALALDPLSPSINSRLGVELFNSGRVDEGLALLLKTTEIDPWQFNAYVRLGWAYASIERFDDAIGAFRDAERVSPGSAPALAGQAYIAARKGDFMQAREMLGTLISASTTLGDPFHAAIVYVGLRDRDNAITWLEKTAETSRILHRAGPYGWQSPLYDWLRDDPRAASLAARIEGTRAADRRTAAAGSP